MHITRIARSAACRSTATRVTIAGKCGSLRLQRQEHFTMRFNGLITISLAIVSLAVFGPAQARPPLYIVQAHTASEARTSVLHVSGQIERELPIIHAVAARLDSQQAARLRAASNVRLFEDRQVATR